MAEATTTATSKTKAVGKTTARAKPVHVSAAHTGPLVSPCAACDEKRRVQSKIEVGQPGDRFEAEADATADKVMRMNLAEVQQRANAPRAQRFAFVQAKTSVGAFLFKKAEEVRKLEKQKAPEKLKVQKTAEKQKGPEQLKAQRSAAAAKTTPAPVIRTVQAAKEEKKLQKKEEPKQLQKAPEKKVQKQTLQLKVATPTLRSKKEEKKIQKTGDEKIQKAPDAAPPQDKRSLSPATESKLSAALGGGQVLPQDVRQFMEPRFGVDFSTVRIHNDPAAHKLAQEIGARAFAYGNHIFFNNGQYNPGSTDGRWLLAHELTHVVQQGHAPALRNQPPARAAEKPKTSTAPVSVQRLGLSDILDGLASLAANVPGFTLITVIIGRNPINMRVVDRSITNILRAFMGLIPGGEILFQVLNSYHVIERIGNWVTQQLSAMGISYDSIRAAFTRFTDSLSWRDIFSPGDVWRRAQDIFTPTITRVRNFISALISQAITWLKETFMQPLSNFCREIPGYTLVTVLLGRDPFTNAPVARSAINIVRAFAEFIPGGTEKVQQLQESHALERASEWFMTETRARNLTWDRVVGTFTAAWNSLRLEDVLSPIATLRRLVNQFTPLFVDLVGFARAALEKLLELIFQAVMGAGGADVLAIIQRVRSTFRIIIADPVGFLRNLLRAVGTGIRQFATNILRHLQQGVIAWLTGPVARAGIQMPERWDLRGIIGFVLQILGLTWDRVRGKLVNLMGERVVNGLETAAGLIMDIREKGLVQALRDRVTEFFGQLREAALGAIRSFIQERMVMAGIQQLLSMLSPVGAVIQAIIKTYTTIQFFLQKINQILALVRSVVDSIAAIAAGNIGGAANFIEQTMARTIPIILDFLARFIGLGDVGARVQTVIRSLQARVDAMLDRAVEWIRTMVQRLVAAGRQAVANVLQWWRARKQFTSADGATHNLFFRGEGANSQLFVASEERPVGAVLQEGGLADQKIAQSSDPPEVKEQKRRLVRTAWGYYRAIVDQDMPALNAVPSPPNGPEIIQRMNSNLNNLASAISLAYFDVSGENLPDTGSPVRRPVLEAVSNSIPDNPQYDRMAKAGGHVWIHLKKRTAQVSNFGITSAVTSGSGARAAGIGRSLLIEDIGRELTQKNEGITRSNYGNRLFRAFRGMGATLSGTRKTDAEAYVMAAARRIKADNADLVSRVDVRVYTNWLTCPSCQQRGQQHGQAGVGSATFYQMRRPNEVIYTPHTPPANPANASPQMELNLTQPALSQSEKIDKDDSV